MASCGKPSATSARAKSAICATVARPVPSMPQKQLCGTKTSACTHYKTSKAQKRMNSSAVSLLSMSSNLRLRHFLSRNGFRSCFNLRGKDVHGTGIGGKAVCKDLECKIWSHFFQVEERGTSLKQSNILSTSRRQQIAGLCLQILLKTQSLRGFHV